MYFFSVTSHSAVSRWWTPAWLAVFLVGVFLAAPALAVGVVSTGKITLTVGQATITSASGAVTAAQRGDAISVGDRIETTLNGHVHVRFFDGALVSVRPDSELLVEEYRYDAAAADRSQVKFKLFRGTARAISGAAAEGAREHFRLNTPLVAIGIRGTDFVVHSDSNLTTAAVSYGAIVMAPFGEGCKAQGLGPCATASARLLSADMSGMLAEYRNGLSHPELKQTTAYNAQVSDLARTASAGNSRTFVAGSGPGPASASAATATASASASAPVATTVPMVSTAATASVSPGGAAAPEVTLVAVNELPHIPYRANNLVNPDSRSADQVSTAAVLAAQVDKQTAVSIPSVAAVVPAVVSPPAVVAPMVVLSPIVLVVSQLPIVVSPAALVWGRWGTDAIGPADFSVVRSDAQTDRIATVGNDKFILYRTNGDFDFSRFAASQGETGFVLDKSVAQFTDSGGKSEIASVLGGSLGINFGLRQFSTALSVTSAATGAQSLAMQGAVDRTGLFVAAQDGQRVAGAIALDGNSAAYLFDKTLTNGVLAGITQWKVK